MGFPVTRVQRCLSGFDYPGTPGALADHADHHGAGPDLVAALRGLNVDSFDGPNAVMEALSAINALGKPS